jgi:threonine/homoserine/homoserine lactone efflux protein
MASDPANVPFVAGENVTLRLALSPGAKVRGRVGALNPKTVVFTCTAVITNFLSPEFRTATERLWLLSGATPVKATLAGVALSSSEDQRWAGLTSTRRRAIREANRHTRRVFAFGG